MHYLTWEFRKPYIDIGIKKFCNLMTFIFREKDIAGWMVAWFLHYIPYFYMLMSIFLYPIKPWMIIGFIITYLSNTFFRGCLCFRIERELFEDKTWVGPYHLMEYWGTKANTKNIILAFHKWTKIIFVMIILKVLYCNFIQEKKTVQN